MATRILVVEDNEDLLEILTRQLAYFGFEVTAAKNGAEGMAMALSRHPDAILMDIVMPKMDGLEAISRIRGNLQTRDIPVMAVTAWLSPDSQHEYKARGFDECISKPFAHKDLLLAIGQLLKGAERRSEPSDLGHPISDKPN